MSGGWVNPKHPQTRIQGVDVDSAMVPLLKELWRLGIRTTASCESFDSMGGAAYVGFVTEEDYIAFKQIVRSSSRVVIDGQPESEVLEKLGDPAYVERVAELGGCWVIAFPPEDLRVVTAAARRLGP